MALVFKHTKYTESTNVALMEEKQAFANLGREHEVKHSRYADGSGSFVVGDLRVSYGIEIMGKVRKMHMNPEVLGLTIEKDSKKCELFVLDILPVVRVIAKRDGLEIVPPHWFKNVTEGYAKGMIPKRV